MKKLLTFLMLGMLSILSLASTDIYLPLLTEISREFNCEISWLQFSISLYILILGISQLLFGAMADRFGFYKTFTVSMIIYILGSFFCAQSSDIIFFLLGRALQAIGASAGLVSWQPLLLQLFTQEQAKSINAILFMLLCLSPGIAPVIGALLATFLDWRANFYFLLCYAIILCGLVLFIVPQGSPKNLSQNKKTFIRNFLLMFRNKVFLQYLLLIACCYSGYLAYLISYPILINSNGKAISVGLQFIPMAISFCIGALISRRLMKFQENRKAISYGLYIYTLSLLLLTAFFMFPFENIVIRVLPAFCLLMLGSGLLLPAASFEALLIHKEFTHSASGIIGSFRMCAAFVVTCTLTLLLELSISNGLILILFFTCCGSWISWNKCISLQERNFSETR